MNARGDPDAPIFLVGFMGVGKSTAGRALAARWGWDFEDTDALVERKESRTIEEIFRASGEENSATFEDLVGNDRIGREEVQEVDGTVEDPFQATGDL